MSNQPQAHVADERELLREIVQLNAENGIAETYASGAIVSDEFDALMDRAKTLIAASTQGTDVADERAAFDKAIADATLTWRSDCPSEVIAWRAWQAARNAQERVDAMHSGVVGVFAAIKAEHAAQPAPASATDARLDAVVEANRALLHQRSQLGIKKYGGTLGEMRHSHRALMQHALEEVLDLANYLQADIQANDAAMLSANSPREAG